LGNATKLSPMEILVDEMHCVHLGVFQKYILQVLWKCITCNVWDVGDGLPEGVVLAATAQRIRSDLWAWYRAQRVARPGKPIYELSDFSVGTLGAKFAGPLHAKAAESGTLLLFALDVAIRFEAQLPGGSALVEAGRALEQYLVITRQHGPSLPPSAVQALVDAVLRFLVMREPAGIGYIPKMHEMVHLVYQSRRAGNPRHWATWEDEGLNMTLAAVARTAHPTVWSRRVLATFAHPAGPTARRASPSNKRTRVERPQD